MKKFKKLFLILTIAIFLIGGIAASTISYAAINDEAYLKAVHIRKNGWGYSLGDINDEDHTPIFNIEKIKQYTVLNGTTEVSSNPVLYCIKGGIGFGAGENTASIDESNETTTYKEIGDFTTNTVFNSINSTYDNYLSSENYYKLVWLLDNLYTEIGKEDEDAKSEYLTTIGKLNPIKIYKAKSSERADLAVPNDETTWSDILNDDDIDTIQQLAIWHFTNPDEDHYDLYQDKGADRNQLVWMKLMNALKEYEIIEEIDKAYNPDPDNEITEEQYRENQMKNVRYTFLRALYANLIESAEENGTEEYFNTRDNTNSDPISLGELEAKKDSGYYIAGPYNIPEEYKDSKYTLSSLNFTDNNNENINGKIKVIVDNVKVEEITDPSHLIECIKNVEDVTKEDIENGNIYIAISADNAKNIENVNFEFEFNYTRNKITYYSAEGNEIQPVVKVEPQDFSIKFNGSFTIPKEFDLALRKYITKVTKTDGTVNELTGTNSREPKLEDEDIAEIENSNTANYKHRKDPVTVEKGDKVNYKITIYNEGNQAGYATKVVDQLPEGLKFIEVVSGNFEKQSYNESEDNTLILTRLDTAVTPIDAFNGTKLSSETIEIQCEVTANPESTNTKILTNVAWIAEEKNTEKGITITNQTGEDRDSQPASTPSVNKNNMSDYKGNTENPSVIPASSNTYYKGYQDDDDFEKVQILPKTFDLALRKFITQVKKSDGTVEKREGTTTREPQINQTELEKLLSATASLDEGKTVAKKHTKAPVAVETGDIVRYTIRVYNEGQIDGKAEEITDYLPDGLQLAENSEINEEYNWKANGNKVTTDYLKNSTLKAFSTKKVDDEYQIDYKDVQIECEVIQKVSQKDLTLKNIAEITKSSNSANLPDRDSEVDNVDIEEYNPEQSEEGKGQQDDDDYEELIIKGKYFDLALRKFATKITKSNGTIQNLSGENSREPEIDLNSLASGTSNLDNGTTAVKTHTKNPIEVETGDIVTYTIRIYNEGQIEGTASEISDYLPEGLELVPQNKSEINKNYGWVADSNDNNKVTTDYLKNSTLKAFSTKKVNNEYQIDYKDVQVDCKVTKLITQEDQTLKNVAEITSFSNSANIETDIDSEPLNVKHNTNNNNYDPTNPTTGRGEQDDDDYEELVLKGKTFDLALRKFIISVDGKELKNSDSENAKYTREPEITAQEITKLASKTATLDNGTTATKVHDKEPVNVKTGDRVIYIIRIYNEGQISGKADLVTDYLPEGLEFIPAGDEKEQSSINKEYGWTANNDDAKIITTEYLKDKTIPALDGTLHYEDLKIECKVSTSDKNVSLKNIAEITDYSNEFNIEDIDSKKNNVSVKDYNPSAPKQGKGEEDDDDYEDLRLSQFDLALRKFITAINETEIKTRIPEVDTTKLKDGTSKTAEYNHSKDPLLVKNSSIITYTIRVYNEGEIDGYASEIKDDMPEGLKFLPDNKTNKLYEWIMLDEDGKETDELDEAVSIVTDYLSKEKEEKRLNDTKNNIDSDNESAEDLTALIPAYDPEEDKLSYKEVKVAFEVIEPNTSDRILKNEAQISANQDKNGNNISDRDSIPNEWNDEDDEDIEKIKVQYFDLSLRKWVTQVIVNDNGDITTTETNHKAEDDPESIVKVEIKDKKLDSISIKFKYKIRVTNEGTIAGYATEIKDYIPTGLKFVAEDNESWQQLDDKTIVTDQAKNILLQSGESTEVEVILTWINSEENLALQMNYAEISKDFNEFDAPDVDSTPDNKQYGEDDIDEAPVLLSIKTGEARIYFIITGSVLLIIIAGISLIKKYII